MLSLRPTVRVFVAVEPIDMRGSFDSLAGAVRRLGLDPVDGHLYLFLNRRRRIAKVLWFDGSGWCVLANRLEAGSFQLPPFGAEQSRVQVDGASPVPSRTTSPLDAASVARPSATTIGRRAGRRAGGAGRARCGRASLTGWMGTPAPGGRRCAGAVGASRPVESEGRERCPALAGCLHILPGTPMPPAVEVVRGDLLDQRVDAIVNAWNRNILPWWLLVPQGVSRAIKKRGGHEPFRELARHGPIPLGGAVLTGPGKLPYRGIIHVAGISMLWRSSEESIRSSVTNAVGIAEREAFGSLALPLIGAGTGGGSEDAVQAIIEDQLAATRYRGRVVVVRYAPPS